MISETDAIEKIRKFIIIKTGLYFKQYDVGPLQENIDERISAAKCSSYLEYYNLLTNSAQSSGEFTELLNRLTIKHTHFFRNPDQFIALRDKILPEIMERKTKTGDLRINILSAGCATGEEPYSIAMLLSDTLDRSCPWTVSIMATDISTEALITAKRGNYPIRALQPIAKGFIQQYIEKYCLIHKDEIFINPAIKTMVEFQYMNLIDEFYPQGFDIIFCRNVTIYFGAETVKNVIEKFYQSLNEEGYFFTGGTETLYGIFDKFKLVELEDALVYRKITAKNLKPADAQVLPRQKVLRIPLKKVQIAQIPAAPTRTLKEACSLYEQAKAAFLKKDYTQTENLAKKALQIEPNLEQARVLLANIFVNQDRFSEAETECRKAITINFLSSQPYYLLGLMLKKKVKYKEALDILRKAIFINPNHSLAHFTLAEIYREKVQTKDAQQAYKNTLKALEKEPEEIFSEFSGGITKNILSQVCVRDMQELSNAG